MRQGDIATDFKLGVAVGKLHLEIRRLMAERDALKRQISWMKARYRRLRKTKLQLVGGPREAP